MNDDDLADWLAARLDAGEPTALVRILEARGSTPRDIDAAMLVDRSAIAGTIGGGSLEWAAIERARELLRDGEAATRWAAPLGPALGQCCGGHVALAIERADAQTLAALRAESVLRRAARPVVYLFGAGHVGRALAQALAPLPFAVSTIDSRPDELARIAGARRLLERPADAVDDLPAGAAAIAATHSHTIDFLVARAALQRGDLAYVGMIGSATKRARFVGWLRASGGDPAIAQALVLPIGGGSLRDKRPEVIAALTASELCTRLLGAA